MANVATTVLVCVASMLATGEPATRPSSAPGDRPPAALAPAEARRVRQAVDKALKWMASRQTASGAFPTTPAANPAVTGLCSLAFLAAGHTPGAGPYGDALTRAVDYILGCQRGDGLLSAQTPILVSIHPDHFAHSPAHTGVYNHAIGGLTLTEVCGMTDPTRAERLRSAVQAAIRHTLAQQARPKREAKDQGGWRYLVPWENGDSDLSVTSWQLLFLRSARNAGFEVPAGAIDDAVLYVQRCFDYRLDKTFHYGLVSQDRRATRAMAGAGILAFSMGGLHGRPEAHAAGDWILAHPFDSYNGPPLAAALPEAGIRDRFHYGVFYCTQAMFQLSGTYWEHFFPVAVDTLLANQSPEGCWAPESAENDAEFGNAYTTALVVLALATPDQLLPICQR